MASIVLGDITNFSCSLNKDSLCGVSDAIESLFTLFIVCYI